MKHLRRSAYLALLSVGVAAPLVGCSQASVRPVASERTDGPPAPAPSPGAPIDAAASTPEVTLAPPGPDGGATATDARSSGPIPTPADFTRTESGGFKLGPMLTSDGVSSPADQKDCNFLIGVIRDFKGRLETGGHPDFETFHGMMPTVGLVGPMLGPDRKPVHTGRCQRTTVDLTACPSGAQTTSAERFSEWYRRTDGVNQTFLIYFSFQPLPNGLLRFDSQSFFPLDGSGFGLSGNDEMKRRRNFHFTTELHARIRYGGGEKFTFSGDDDLWVFINDRLALDLGGLHPAANGTIDLDAAAATLGISKGNTYPIELFHAERRTDGSHFRVETNFVFVDCGQVID